MYLLSIIGLAIILGNYKMISVDITKGLTDQKMVPPQIFFKNTENIEKFLYLPIFIISGFVIFYGFSEIMMVDDFLEYFFKTMTVFFLALFFRVFDMLKTKKVVQEPNNYFLKKYFQFNYEKMFLVTNSVGIILLIGMFFRFH